MHLSCKGSVISGSLSNTV